ncbi:MarR family winged helix-turn-helix transcriptional regulator [Streptococcus macacae]|uniref:Transcriptional regulator, MarR family n=1 Tax=Streptococcus macacae NCTC 11558 TaxID=764298 RepID=G5JU24_9STRE|nr:MarR family winged helix-turn-helix transcriptional regulator [Streptococcus macacae]EHJ51621.1 transcriptional regulator, MarR family [Streptococcus macacae NCTC 11558]SUN78390.1 transcriptional regulator [Streptococcus macacae NCTC 11558]
MKEPLGQFRILLNTIENRVQEISKGYDIESLAGPQGSTVVFLLKNQDQELFIKDIEKELQVSKSVASNLVKRMQKNGFVKIIPSLSDKRRKQVVLTPFGLEKAKEMQFFLNDIYDAVLADIKPEELAVAKKVFRQIQSNLENRE